MKINSSLWSRLLLSALIALGIGLFATQKVQAVAINNQGNLPADQTVDDDLLISGETVSVDGTVNGLVIASGAVVNVNGTINGDLFAFGQTVKIGPDAIITGNVFSGAREVENAGQVEGSFFAGAMSLDLSGDASVARNLFFGGYAFTAAETSNVGRDLYMGGYQALLNGSVGNNVKIDGGAVQVNGTIGGDADFVVEASETETNVMDSFAKSQGFEMPAALPAGLTISDSAQITGKLTYTSPVNYESAIQAQPAGGVVYQTPVPSSDTSTSQAQQSSNKEFDRNTLWITFLKFLRNFVMLAIVGILLVLLAPKALQKTVAAVQTKPLQSAGVGILSILITYPGALIVAGILGGFALLLALIGLGEMNSIILGLGFSSLGVVVTGFTVLLKFVSKCILAFFVGDLLMKQLFPTLSRGRSIWAMVIGTFLFTLIGIIPVLGWVVSLVATLVGLGAIWYGLVVKPATPPAIPQVVQ